MNPSLDGLLRHLCASYGLFSRQTFLSLYSCVARLIRDHRMQGLVLTCTQEDPDFDTLADGLEHLSDIDLFRVPPSDLLGFPETGGVLLVLTDRLCATLYWTVETESTFRMLEGGWTFHPGDCRRLAQQLTLSDSHFSGRLATVPMDRRYDEKVTMLITSLVNSLEHQNRELAMALDDVQALNRRVVDSERLAAIGQLSAVIAHELRNPLGLIDLYAKLAEMGVTGDQPKETVLGHLGTIRDAVQNLSSILSELTDYSRPLTLQRQPTDVNTFVEGVGRFFEPSLSEKGLEFQFEPGSEAMTLPLDQGRIRQALINLLKNALEATPSGGKIKLTVATRKDDADVFIKVQDTGTGVPDALQAKLFTPYFSTKGGGTGLGLAHSQKVLQAHGGRVSLLTTGPTGSTFALVLPRSERRLSGE
jgi:signal transduction histidine kinase